MAGVIFFWGGYVFFFPFSLETMQNILWGFEVWLFLMGAGAFWEKKHVFSFLFIRFIVNIFHINMCLPFLLSVMFERICSFR